MEHVSRDKATQMRNMKWIIGQLRASTAERTRDKGLQRRLAVGGLHS
ncbi:MAG: hypothetical protein RIQ93_3008 [Verrucomicrobiota bacterium]|jgi:hypothetical protein